MSRPRVSSAFALLDVGLLADPKFGMDLRVALPDPDQFNSAVGAWVIALLASRRNGSPEIDVAAQTRSSYIAQLRAAGLLTETGFSPEAWGTWAPHVFTPDESVVGGIVRATTARRDVRGRFQPVQPESSPTQPVPAGSSPSSGRQPVQQVQPTVPAGPARSSGPAHSSQVELSRRDSRIGSTDPRRVFARAGAEDVGRDH